MFAGESLAFDVPSFLDAIIPRMITKALWVLKCIVNLNLRISKLNAKKVICLSCLSFTSLSDPLFDCLSCDHYRVWGVKLLKPKASKRNLQVQLFDVIRKVKT
jgi:hypothetical protein